MTTLVTRPETITSSSIPNVKSSDSISFSDTDSALDSTGNESLVSAPKDIQHLEELRRRREEEEEGGPLSPERGHGRQGGRPGGEGARDARVRRRGDRGGDWHGNASGDRADDQHRRDGGHPDVPAAQARGNCDGLSPSNGEKVRSPRRVELEQAQRETGMVECI